MGVSSVGSSTIINQSATVVEPADASAANSAAGSAERSTCLGPNSAYTGPSGSVKQGDATYEVTNGSVSLNGTVIGTVNDAGDYSVKLNGQEVKGNVAGLIGAAVEGTLSTGAKVDNRPTGEVDVGGQHYAVDRGIVSLNGKKVGTINDAGDFNVGGSTGNVTKLTGAIYDGKLGNKKPVDNRLSGDVHLGNTDYTVRKGHVFNGDGKDIGTVDEKGGFAVKVDGRNYVGNINTLFGASYLAARPDKTQIRNSPSGLVSVNGKDYQVVSGKVFLDGKRIGSVSKDGDYTVKINGKFEQGNVAKLKGARVIVSGQ